MSQRTYGWSPKQMARINSRREARGQKPYIDSRMKSDASYNQEYQEGEDDYLSFQKKIAEKNKARQVMDEDKKSAFAKQSASTKTNMQQREQGRQDLGRMNVDFLKMKQSGGKMSWDDFKKMWSSQKVLAPNKKSNTASLSYA